LGGKVRETVVYKASPSKKKLGNSILTNKIWVW
jgi:hypothetical protein